MFHVSTLLPFTPDNPLQLERKRHVGNDISILIFKEGNSLFLPNSISSEFIHVIGVVQPEEHNKKTLYRFSVASKDGVPHFPPKIMVNSRYELNQSFRKLILTKLINGEKSAYKSPKFNSKFEKVRSHLLNKFGEKRK